MHFSGLRSFQRSITGLNIKVFPKIKVQRNLAFERHLIAGTPANNRRLEPASNRRPEQAVAIRPEQANLRQPVHKNKAIIPFGKRGSKRETRKTIQFRGLIVNPDSRQTKPPTTSGSTIQTVNASVREPMVLRQPAKRSYAIATSTPLAKLTLNHRARGDSYPLPAEPPVLRNITNPDENQFFQVNDNFESLRYDALSDSE